MKNEGKVQDKYIYSRFKTLNLQNINLARVFNLNEMFTTKYMVHKLAEVVIVIIPFVPLYTRVDWRLVPA